MPIHDISLPISESLIIWPGDPEIVISQPYHLARGDSATVSRICMGAHAGTHVDAPAHYIAGGKKVEALALDALVGQALVVAATDVAAITADFLEAQKIAPTTERILLRTRNSETWGRNPPGFHEDFVALTECGARWLAARGVRLVGIDGPSVAPFAELAPIHRILLAQDIVVVEGLDLRGIAPGFYQLVCLPLKIAGAEAAPVRAILIGQNKKMTW